MCTEQALGMDGMMIYLWIIYAGNKALQSRHMPCHLCNTNKQMCEHMDVSLYGCREDTDQNRHALDMFAYNLSSRTTNPFSRAYRLACLIIHAL